MVTRRTGESRTPFRVLIVCTGNAARSQMAEALLARLGDDRFEVASAGSRPAGFVHPLALVALVERGLDVAGLRSKGVDELFAGGARFDLVITVCDDAAVDCPTFPGAKHTVHWGLPDPSWAVGGEAERLAAFRATRDALERRLARLVALSDQELGSDDLVARLGAIHREA